MIGIYAIYNIINKKYYIGQTKDVDQRWIQHRSRLKCQTHENKHLQNAYNKYGKDSFKYILIEECTIEDLNDKEIFYIKYYDSYNNGYNQDLGGNGCIGYKHSEEEILKMRLIQNPKSILQIDSNLNIVNEWISCAHAGKTLGISISGIKACCERINYQKTINGYYWIYKDEYDNSTVDWEYYLNKKSQAPKRVSMYDVNMNLIKIYKSVSEVKHDGFNIASVSQVCNFKSKTHKNFIWRFTDEYTEEQFIKDKNCNFNYNKNKTKRKIAQYNMNGDILNIYNSLSEIEKQLGFPRTQIAKCCKGKAKTSHGYVWKYAD